MPRPRTHSRDDLIASAMAHFWQHGYGATSMDDLVGTTGASRHGIYAAFGGKHDLFLACLDAYQDAVVSPAFAQVEAEGAGIEAIGRYFAYQIARAEDAGLPGPGCLVANTMTECAPHDAAAWQRVETHNRRLQDGFLNALHNERRARGKDLADGLEELALVLVVFAQGLWSMSRNVTDAAPLRRAVATMLQQIGTRITP